MNKFHKEINNKGLILWLVMGLFTTVLGITHGVVWLISVWIWIILVEDVGKK